MKSRSETSTQISLDIGGLGFDLLCSDPSLAHRLAARYRGYPPLSTERFTADLIIQPGQKSVSLLQQPVTFTQGVLVWDGPGCQGKIDPYHRRGILETASELPEADAEYFLRMACALMAFEAGGLLFHAAGIVREGEAYIFFGRSGSGKSTVVRLSSGCAVFSDDLLLLISNHERWWAYPTPFWNIPGVSAPVPPAPVAGLYHLVQDTQVYRQPLQGAFAVAEMLASVPVVSADPARSAALIQRCQAILAHTPAYSLHFLLDDSFWQVIAVH